jgi:hypothetical protein
MIQLDKPGDPRIKSTPADRRALRRLKWGFLLGGSVGTVTMYVLAMVLGGNVNIGGVIGVWFVSGVMCIHSAYHQGRQSATNDSADVG